MNRSIPHRATESLSPSPLAPRTHLCRPATRLGLTVAATSSALLLAAPRRSGRRPVSSCRRAPDDPTPRS